MARPDLTDITLVLDRSGSMASVKDATIEAFNGFLQSQRGGAGTAQMTLVQFDDQYEPLYTARPLVAAPLLNDQTFVPRGCTALLDAMGRTIVCTGKRLREMPEADRPGTVLFVTLTDGLENASREYTLEKINAMIAEQRDKYSWQFIFLAANQDAIAAAARMGIGAAQALTYSHSTAGIQGCLNAFGGKLHALRKRMFDGEPEQELEFDEADRDAAHPSRKD
jgi:hypothetical protein